MPSFIKIGGTHRTVGNVWRNVSGVWKTGILWRNISGTWKAAATAMTASITPDNYYSSGTTNPITSGSITCTPTGGAAPYTYLWQFVSGGASTVSSTTAATVTFSSNVTLTSPRVFVWYCQVTDSIGTVVSSNPVEITFERF